MPRSRRALLASLAAGVVFAGCSGQREPRDSETMPEESASQTTDATPTYPSHDETRATGDPITVEEAEQVTEYETFPSEEWAQQRCVSFAADAAHAEARRRLDFVSLGRAVTTWEGESAVVVIEDTQLRRDGSPVETPEVSFERLKFETPASVTVTVRDAEQSHSCTVPVLVELSVERAM